MDTEQTNRNEVHNPEVEGSKPSLATEEKSRESGFLFFIRYNIGTTNLI